MKLTIKTTVLILITIFSLCSCSKHDQKIAKGYGKIKIEIGNTFHTNNRMVGSTEIDVRNQYFFLEDEIQRKQNLYTFKQEISTIFTHIKNSAKITTNHKLSTEPKQGSPVPLAIGSQYQILIYDNLGKFTLASEKLIYSNNISSNTWEADLQEGIYTIIMIAVAPNKSLPNIDSNKDLSAATVQVQNATTDLLWQKQSNVQINTDNETLKEFTLQHLFTQVTVTIESSNSILINSISGTNFITPNYNSATIKLIDGSYTATGLINQPLNFTKVNQTFVSSPTLIILNQSTNQASINLENVNVTAFGNVKSGPVTLDEIALAPGVNYNLILNLIPKNAIDIPGTSVYWGTGNLRGGGGATSASAIETTPSGLGNLYEGKSSTSYCENVLSTGWITASKENFEELLTAGSVKGNFNNVLGWFLGTNNKTEAESNPEKYMFLPINGVGRQNGGTSIPSGVIGGYWAFTGSSGNNLPAIFLFENKVEMGVAHQNNYLGIRCIKVK